MRYQRAQLPLKLDGLAAAREFFAGCIADGDLTREQLWVAHVDDEARCIHMSRHSGNEDSANFPLGQIVADAAVHGSSGIVLAHNHPSGDSQPSRMDLQATRKLAAATEALDCVLLDHLVFGGAECSSMRGLGYL